MCRYFDTNAFIITLRLSTKIFINIVVYFRDACINSIIRRNMIYNIETWILFNKTLIPRQNR